MTNDLSKDPLFRVIARDQATQERIRRAGEYEGRHYLDWVEEVKQLKREKRYAEAEKLLRGLVRVAERQARIEDLTAPPWYQTQLDLVRRQIDRERERSQRGTRRNQGGPPRKAPEQKKTELPSVSKRLYFEPAGSLMVEVRWSRPARNPPSTDVVIAATLGEAWKVEWDFESAKAEAGTIVLTLRSRKAPESAPVP